MSEQHEERRKFPRELVFDVFLELGKHFDPEPTWQFDGNSKPEQRPLANCERLCAVGGFRRLKTEMKDLEILYIPRFREEVIATSLFGDKESVNVTERMIEGLRESGVLEKRHKVDGSISAWGPENKHAVHVASGLPIDLFAATEENYINRLVVTTGPAASNIRIAAEARRKGFEWEVYDAGFVPLGYAWGSCPPEKRVVVKSEREAFEFVGLEYFEPQFRL